MSIVINLSWTTDDRIRHIIHICHMAVLFLFKPRTCPRCFFSALYASSVYVYILRITILSFAGI